MAHPTSYTIHIDPSTGLNRHSIGVGHQAPYNAVVKEKFKVHWYTHSAFSYPVLRLRLRLTYKIRKNKKREKYRRHYCYFVCMFFIDIFNVYLLLFLFFHILSFSINFNNFMYYSHNCTLFIQLTPIYINHVTEAHKTPLTSKYNFLIFIHKYDYLEYVDDMKTANNIIKSKLYNNNLRLKNIPVAPYTFVIFNYISIPGRHITSRFQLYMPHHCYATSCFVFSAFRCSLELQCVNVQPIHNKTATHELSPNHFCMNIPYAHSSP